jgi:Ni,Fe-hydrogenase maturation factor
VDVVAVEAAYVDRFGADLTPPVAAAVEPAVRAVLELVSGRRREHTPRRPVEVQP